MLWFVEISPLGKSEAEPERACVEASHWQEAIKGIRRATGLDDALRNFSIEVLDEGIRAVDPMSRKRYVIRRAPDDAPLTGQASEPASAASAPDGKKPRAHTMMYGSPGSAEISQAVEQAQAQSAGASQEQAAPAYTRAVLPPDKAPSQAQPSAPQPEPASPPPADETQPATFAVVAKREQEPTKSSPLTYREYAYAIAEGSTEDDAEQFIVERFKEIRDALSVAHSAKLVNLAVFDHEFERKPKRPPLVTLVWKDWKGNPEVRYTSRPGVSIPPPSLGRQVSSSPPAAKPSQPLEQGGGSSTAPTPVTRAPAGEKRGNLGPPQSTMRSAGPDTDPSLLKEKAPVVSVQTNQAAAEPSPEAKPKAASQPPAAKPKAASQPPAAKPKAASQPPAAKPKAASQPPAAKPKAASQPPAAAKRPSGDEIIADIFESMHDLHFLRDAYEGADFVISLALDKMRCKLGMAQLYDINRREFVVAHAVGPGSDQALGNRTSEHDPLLAEVMRRHTPFVIHVAEDTRVREGRWKSLGGEPQTILVCAVAQGGRFLGILELAHRQGEGEFRKADIHGLAYIAESFAEFVAKTGLMFGSEKNLMSR